MGAEGHDNGNYEPLLTLKDQMALAHKNNIPVTKGQFKALYEKSLAENKVLLNKIGKLEHELSLLIDRDKIAHMEDVLIEYKLMPYVEEYAREWVRKEDYDLAITRQKNYLATCTKLRLQLEAQQVLLDECKGIKRSPGDEKL